MGGRKTRTLVEGAWDRASLAWWRLVESARELRCTTVAQLPPRRGRGEGG